MTNAYRDDLAYIHDAGYTGLAEAAAGVLLETLRRDCTRPGLVIDLGCGGRWPATPRPSGTTCWASIFRRR